MIARFAWAAQFIARPVLCTVCLPLSGTIVPYFSLEQLTERADMILQARVVKAWTAWDPRHKFIWTHYQLTALDVLKQDVRSNQGRSAIVVSEIGGTLGRRSMEIPGTPHLKLGEELILFVHRTPIGYLRTLGYGQGRYTISGGKMAVNLDGIELARKPESSRQTSPQDVNGLSVAEFKRRVRAIMKTHA